MTRLLIQKKDSIFGQDIEGSDRQSALEENINHYIQLQEYQILVSAEWNLNMPTGSNIFNLILKMSNESFDFSDTIKVVNKLSQLIIFFSEISLDSSNSSFNLKGHR